MLEYCFDVFNKMYDEGYLKQIEKIPPENLIELRFEDLTANPVEEIRRIYDYFGMKNTDKVLEKVADYFSDRANYKKNKHSFSPEIENRISKACAAYMKRFGYTKTENPSLAETS